MTMSLWNNPITNSMVNGGRALFGIDGDADKNNVSATEALCLGGATLALAICCSNPIGLGFLGVLGLFGAAKEIPWGGDSSNIPSGANNPDAIHPADPKAKADPAVQPYTSTAPPVNQQQPPGVVFDPVAKDADTPTHKIQPPKGADTINDEQENKPYYVWGDSQGGTAHGNYGTNQSKFQCNNNGGSQVGASPLTILNGLKALLSNSDNVSSLKERGIVLSPGADNADVKPNPSVNQIYKDMRTLLDKKGIKYTIIPPGDPDHQDHLASLNEAFKKNNILDITGVKVNKKHYEREGLIQAIEAHLLKKQPTVV